MFYNELQTYCLWDFSTEISLPILFMDIFILGLYSGLWYAWGECIVNILDSGMPEVSAL